MGSIVILKCSSDLSSLINPYFHTFSKGLVISLKEYGIRVEVGLRLRSISGSGSGSDHRCSIPLKSVKR